jgi:hypothetical protein
MTFLSPSAYGTVFWLPFGLCLQRYLRARTASRQPRTRAEQWDVRASAPAFSFAFSISLHA